MSQFNRFHEMHTAGRYLNSEISQEVALGCIMANRNGLKGVCSISDGMDECEGAPVLLNKISIIDDLINKKDWTSAFTNILELQHYNVNVNNPEWKTLAAMIGAYSYEAARSEAVISVYYKYKKEHLIK